MSGPDEDNREEEGLLGEATGGLETGPTEQGAGGGATGRGELEPRHRLGRYELRGLVGAGGMGLVYAAWDPHLGRKVALKVLRPGLGEQRRLLREARALARLSHPRIITVYDAGVVGEEFFIAMELVEGETLAAWLKRGRRSWHEVVEVYARAGEGLAAAHAVGVVHCDFKPDNVLLGGDGRVRVLDFGIALLGEEPGVGSAPPGPAPGTWAYMAPEQHEPGREVDARSDQYSFCVALYEGLYGQRPFERTGEVERLAMLKRAEAWLPPPLETEVPAQVHRVVVRGLRAAPGERWPSMQALLAELRRHTRRPRRRWLLAGALVATHLGGFAAAWSLREHTSPAPCEDGAHRLAGIWDEPSRDRTRSAILTHGGPHAQATWARVEQVLEGYTTRWVASYAEACAATHVRQVQSSRLLDHRMACLEGRLRSVAALVELLQQGDRALVRAAPEALRELPELETCADVEALLDAQPLPDAPGPRRQVSALRHELARAQVLLDAGRYGQALRQASAQAGHVLALGYLPLRAELELLRGRACLSLLRLEPARQHLGQAVWAAEASHHDGVAAYALSLMYQVDTEREELRERAEAAILRSGREELRALLATAEGGRAFDRGEHAQALTHFQRALALYERHRGRERLSGTTLLNNLAATHKMMGQYALARQVLSRALDLGERQLGAEHPKVLLLRLNEAHVLVELGQYARALAQAEASLVPLRAELGARHTHVRLGELVRAHALFWLGRHEEAQASLTELLALEEGPRERAAPPYLEGVNLLGRLRVAQGQPRRARELLHQTLEELRRQGLPPAAPLEANLLTTQGLAWLHLGRPERARRVLDQALQLQQRALPASHPDLATTLHLLGQLHARQGRCAAALPVWERARLIRHHALGPRHPLLLSLLSDMARCGGRSPSAPP
ncbi:MAG TPA: tetratricopeptide repeat protein [Archangium sp.]|uniref:protein kinase domain-containing protein n=1 Tax=Archangium sp. TaxID=1872627 RepID=UPI002E2F5FCE|nr:tetratricopeptide repeat protein [Archangium sp.]HEX5752972.1 tetratricopeptide repeat protein [Archangium sp.]